MLADRASITRFLVSLMLFDELSGVIGVPCPNENSDIEDLGEPGLPLSIQFARNPLAAQGILDDLRHVGIFERIGRNEFVSVNIF
jgi:hypothetical protein